MDSVGLTWKGLLMFYLSIIHIFVFFHKLACIEQCIIVLIVMHGILL